MDVHPKKPVISGAGAPRSWNDRYKAQSLHADIARPLSRDPKALSSDRELETQVRKWVSQTFYGTLLKQMRESPFKSDLFSGGRGEQAFGPLYDAQLADRMARGTGDKLVGAITRRIRKNRASEARKAYERQNYRTSPTTSPGKEQTLATAGLRA